MPPVIFSGNVASRSRISAGVTVGLGRPSSGSTLVSSGLLSYTPPRAADTVAWIRIARSRTQATLAAYRGGKANLAEVLAARRSELDVRLQALQRKGARGEHALHARFAQRQPPRELRVSDAARAQAILERRGQLGHADRRFHGWHSITNQYLRLRYCIPRPAGVERRWRRRR